MARVPTLARAKRWLIPALGALVLYGGFGFLIAPGLVRTRLVKTASASTHRRISLGKVSVNPFVLSVTLRDFVIADRNGERLFSCDTLYVNFQLSSVVRRAYTFAEVRLAAPYLRTLVRADGTVNLQDVIPQTAARDSNAPAARPIPVLLFHIDIARGQLVYENRQRTTPFVARIDPLNLSLRDLTTRPLEQGVYQFEAATDRGERLAWRGDISIVPVRSAGHLELSGFQARSFWRYEQDVVNYDVTGGRARFAADYELDLSVTPPVFMLRNGEGQVDSLALSDRRTGATAATVALAAVRGLEADVTHRMLRIADVRTSGGSVSGTYGTDSTFSLATLFLPRVDPKAPVDSGPDWKVDLVRLAIDSYVVNIEDRTTRPVARLALAPLALTLENYRYGMPGDARVDLRFGIDHHGSVAITGSYTPEPRAAALDLRLDAVPLRPFQPYVNTLGRLILRSGTLSLAGRATYHTRGTRGDAAFQGGLHIDGLRAVDPALKEDFTRWNRLEVNTIAYRSAPASLAIGSIVTRGLYLRAIVGPNRVTNIQNIFSPPSDTAPQSAEAAPDSAGSGAADTTTVAPDTAPPPVAPSAPSAPSAPAATTTMATRVDEIRVVDGTLNFSDYSLTPNFTVSIAGLAGAITGLSSDQPASGVVDLAGRVDRYAPATIKGQVNPLSAHAYTDLTLNFQGIELTTFTPYSGKFAGYKIDKGKLTLVLHYKLNQRMLVGENHIVLDQLTLGEKVQSPDATSLPVKLAVALLKDSHGVIDLNIPVSGSLDDPHFRVMPLVLKALVRLFVKVVTSPFHLLGALFGGKGDSGDLAYVAFSPGSDTLHAAEAAKIDTLARALEQRPGLTLGIRGTVAPVVDQDALAMRAVLLELRRGDSTVVGPPLPEEVGRLSKMYRRQFNEDPAKLVPATDSLGNKLPKAERQARIAQAALARLVSQYRLPDDALSSLARRRAARIKERLVLVDSIAEPRLYLQGVDTTGQVESGAVRVQLALDAR